MGDINIKKMKQWFKQQGRKKKVQFSSSTGHTPYSDIYPPRRAITPDISYVRSLDVSMSTSGHSTPRGNLSKLVRSRTPDSTLSSYYLDDEEPRSVAYQKSSSLPRQPFHAEPRFTSENTDSNIRGRNHGYYIKASGISGQVEGDKENVRLIYDRSRMASPVASGHTSQYTSKVSSNIGSRSGSFRNNPGQRRYLPKKRPAPRMVNGSARNNGGEHVPYRRYNSLDSHTANGEVAMKVFRKKRKAPQPPTPSPAPPPPPVQRSWVDDKLSKSPFRAIADPSVYPIEPPVDYNKKVEESSEEEDDISDVDLPLEDIQPPRVDAQPSEEEQMETAQSVVEVMVHAPPEPPLPPPLPFASDAPVPNDIDAPMATTPDEPQEPEDPPSSRPEGEVEKPEVMDTSPKDKLPRMGSLLRKDIVQAAMVRANKGFVDPQPEYKSPHQIFAAELQAKVKRRDERMCQGALKVRALSSSKMFKARPSITPADPTKTHLDDMIKRAQEQAQLRVDREDEQRRMRGSARVMTKEWLPEHDLDDVFNEEVNQSKSQLTSRGGNYYDITDPDEEDSQSSGAHQALYRKNHNAKASRKKTGNLEKLRRSIGKAFGSIGKGLHRKTAEIQEMYSKADGWEIIFKEECDPPPTEMIKIKRMEKHPAYAYHAEKEQLILLPDYDRIIVTQDGRRIRETEMSKTGKQAQNKSLPSIGRKERPSLDGLFQTGTYSQVSPGHRESTAEERKQIDQMEDQFEQVRKLNKTQTKAMDLNKQWKSTPDLVKVMGEENCDAGVFSDTDLPLRTSSMKANDKEKSRSVDKLSLSKKKKKSKSKKSSSTSDKSPRQKVLQKGMDYYIRQRPTTPNPVYSSDEENEAGYDAPNGNSDPTSSDSSSKPKSDSLGDSGIGQESLNSSASTASGAPLAAQVQQDALLQSTNGPPNGQMYYSSMPPNTVFLAPMPTPVMLASSGAGPNPMMYQTMYYPSNSLPHGAHVPPMAGEQAYQTLPANLPATKLNESGVTNSDSNSTLVPSNNSTLDHKTTVTVTNNSTGEATAKATSKVFPVSPNIALVSYNNNGGNKPTTDTVPVQQDDSGFQRQLKKEYVMGPIGYRPVKFDPKLKTQPVSLPDKVKDAVQDINGNGDSVDTGPSAKDSATDVNSNKNYEDKQTEPEVTCPDDNSNQTREAEDQNKGRISPCELEDQDRMNNNDPSTDPIPQDIRHKYADEELIYL